LTITRGVNGFSALASHSATPCDVRLLEEAVDQDVAAAQHAEEAYSFSSPGSLDCAHGNERSRRLATHIDNSGPWAGGKREHRDQALLDLVQPGVRR
jgi:hypothetical protein